jgi:hypothetical protein
MTWLWRVRSENERALRAAMKGEKVYGQGGGSEEPVVLNTGCLGKRVLGLKR